MTNPKGKSFERVCFHAIRYANRHGGLKDAEKFIKRAGWGDSTFGIESVTVADRSARYINTGDSYSTTVIEEDNECFVSTWGDWAEETERIYCETEASIRCGYCGKFTDVDEDDWRMSECSCGHYVDGSSINQKGNR